MVSVGAYLWWVAWAWAGAALRRGLPTVVPGVALLAWVAPRVAPVAPSVGGARWALQGGLRGWQGWCRERLETKSKLVKNNQMAQHTKPGTSDHATEGRNLGDYRD